LLRTGLRVVLDGHPALRVVAEAVSVPMLALAVRTHSPSVAVVDIDLPGMPDNASSGQLPAQFRALRSQVLLVGETCDAERVLRLLSGNVRGFVCKSCPPHELAGAATAVAAGHASLPAEVTSRLLDYYVLDGQTTAADPYVPLTRRERDVLRLMVDGNSTIEIARALVVQTSTVKSHIYHLLRKLGVNDRAQAVALAYRSGLLRSTIARHTVTRMDSRNFSHRAEVG